MAENKETPKKAVTATNRVRAAKSATTAAKTAKAATEKETNNQLLKRISLRSFFNTKK